MFRVDDYAHALVGARVLVERFAEEPHVNPNTRTSEFSVCDPDGYFVTISFADGLGHSRSAAFRRLGLPEPAGARQVW